MTNARPLITVALLTLVGLATPAAARAATTVGATPPPGAQVFADCVINSNHTTRTSTIANPYVATVSGVITEWQFQADTTGTAGTVAMQTLQPGGDAFTYTPLAESAVETPVNGTLNRFATRIPIAAGQFIGLRVVLGGHGCFTTTSSNEYTDFGRVPAALPGSGPQMFGNAMASAATNIAATIEPDGDNDGFGDETQDGCPKNAGRSDDCIAPSVKIDKGPKKKIKKPKTTFTFSSDEETVSFECSLDDKKFAACTSPLKIKKLAKGKHTFAVRAIDKNNNTSDEAGYKWKVKPKK